MTREDFLQLREQVLNYERFDEIENIIPKMSAYQYLHECNDDRLDNYALNYLGRKYTFRELFEKIDIAAKGFKEKGVKPGDVVCMAMLSTPEAIISFYALNKLGAVVYMVNATHEKPAIREELLDSGAKLLVINDIFYDKDLEKYTNEAGITDVVAASLDDTFPIGFLGDRIKYKFIKFLKKVGNACDSDKKCIRWKEFEKHSKTLNMDIEPYYEKNCGLMISSTSGSTGKPKRPLLTNESINAMPIQMGMSCDSFAPNDSILTSLPIWIIYTLFNSIHEPLCLGVTVDLDPIFNSKKVSKRFKQYRFNHWNSIPSYIEDMLEDSGMKNLDLSHLKSITTGGDYRSPKLKMRGEELLKANNSDCEIGQGYGLSETGGCFGYTYEKNMPAESIGKPLVGSGFKILDVETGKRLGPNEPGRLYLYSPAMMKEYFKNHEATVEALVRDENGTVWYKTDDIAHYDEKGRLYLDGRMRRIEISRDANGVPTKVFPDKVKQVISLHPAIEDCEILMVPDDKRITRPVAFLVLKENYVVDNALLSQIVSICNEHKIESYMIPTEYKELAEIPRNASLKVDFKKLKEMYAEQQQQAKPKILQLFGRKRFN